MDFDTNIPVYLQIISYLKDKIIKQDLKEGEKMPSVRELAKELKVNPNTVQRAYRELESEDMIYSKRGMGSYVTQDTQKINGLKRAVAKEIVEDFATRMGNIGLTKDDMLEIIQDYVKGDASC